MLKVRMFAFILVFFVCASGVRATPTIYYVNLNATGSNNGLSWSNAWTDLQSALTYNGYSPGDEVRIAQGVYKPGSNPEDSFVLDSRVDGVKILGGFRGGAMNPDDRDIDTFVTILTGDLAGNDVSCTDTTHLSDNAEHVLIADGITDADTLLEGFTITHGAADRSPNAIFRDYGGGLVNNDVVAYLINECKFTCNRSNNAGGGVANLLDIGPIFTNCSFEFNVTGNQAGGGAVFQNTSNSTFTNCTFSYNATDSFGLGGAVYAFSTDRVICDTCNFEENTAGTGGAVFAEGIGISAAYTNCTYSNNEAEADGGAIYHSSVLTTSLDGCTFEQNLANGGYGGAIYSHVDESSGQELRITSSSFGANTAHFQGGAIYNTGPSLRLRKTSFTGNEATTDKGGAILDYSHSPLFVDCQFEANTAGASGGAVHTTGFGSDPIVNLINSRFLGNEALNGYDGGGLYTLSTDLQATNCHWADNHAGYDGGAILCNSAASAVFTNCTIADNTAANEVGGVFAQYSNCTLKNCVLWGNMDNSGLTTGAQAAASYSFDVTYSDVMGGVLGGAGNISTDPLFVDTAPADPTLRIYRLTLCSPAIDVGNNSDVPVDSQDVNDDMNTTEPTPDLDIRPRIVDNPHVAGSGAVVDMGAYEWQVPTCATPGDLNDDTYVNGLDIQPFVDCVIPGDPAGEHCDCGDINLDGATDYYDIPCFVQLLLGNDACLDGCSGERGGLVDCNANGVTDDLDLFFGTSADCNQNFIPDECDIANETSVDIDGNGVPDECQPDCNGNSIPDVWDIDPEDPDGNEEVSADCNENGIPDECERDCNSNGVPDDCDVDPLDPDGDEWVSADCNANGIPDECELDCNENGVPDDCDLDPLDPDGDEWVSADCNANGLPDECDLALPPPYGSYDCNDNEVPDECDIADETSCDANENGVPDECEIALETCDDLDEDGCCDEGESLMMGGGQGGGESMMGGESSESQSPCAGLTESECWDLYFEWAMEQCWGRDCETTGFEQFRAARAKLAELGLTWPM